ncbi:MAG: PaaI family thioesterase [Candidatus Competibacterales bacterium]
MDYCLETPFQPRAPDFRRRVTENFHHQRAMATLGMRLVTVVPGGVELRFDYRLDLTQQNGFIHAGVITTALDSACGYAAFSLMPAEAAVLSVEFKTNLLAPAQGDYFRVFAKVIKPGRTITFAQGEAFALGATGGGERESSKRVATMAATMMCLTDRPELNTGEG